MNCSTSCVGNSTSRTWTLAAADAGMKQESIEPPGRHEKQDSGTSCAWAWRLLVNGHWLHFLRCAVACTALCTALGANAAEFTFAAFGDTPYNEDEEARFPDFIAELNREELAFAIHVGDLKSAASVCSDELYLERRRWFGLSHHPFAFVPGDNDWLDCGRALFDGRDPRERLQKLRAIFFDSGRGLGQKPLKAVRQPDVSPGHAYPEHLRWLDREVLFMTLNVPGPNNNARDAAEHAPRNEAISEWVDDSFRLARTRGLRAVVVFMHASAWNSSGMRRRAFRPLLDQLARETRRFGRPVLLVHGDEHQYRVDHPLLDESHDNPITNFTRVEVFGSPDMNWVRIRIIEEAGRIRWEVKPGS